MLFVIHLFSLTGKLKGVLIIIQASYSSTLAERVRAPARACVCVLRRRAQIARLLLRTARGINDFFLLNKKFSSNGRVLETLTQTHSIFSSFFDIYLNHGCTNDLKKSLRKSFDLY